MTNKFPIGSQWKTRAGNRAVVVDHDGLDNMIVWHPNGECTHDLPSGRASYSDQQYDLLTPWTEPRKGTFWVNVYDGNKLQLRTIHDCRETADNEAAQRVKNDRLACIEINWTEGQGI